MRRLALLMLALAPFFDAADATVPRCLRAGQRLYEENCVACHAMDGSGGGRGADLRHKLKYGATRKEIAQVIRHGIPSMMPRSDLSDRQIQQLAGYVLYLNRPAQRAKDKK